MATSNLGFDNFFESTITSDITASATTITVATPPTASEGYLVLESDNSTTREIIYYTSKSGSDLTLPSALLGRGLGGTTAQAHTSGASIRASVTAEHFEALQDGTALATSAITTTKIANASVTPAKWTNPYCFYAYDSAGTTLTDGNTVQISLGTEVYDYNGNFAANAYTAPVAGVYHFNGQMLVTGSIATGVTTWVELRKNGSVILFGTRFLPVNNATPVVSGDLLLAAGDVITLYGHQDSAGNETTATGVENTFLSGHLVHAV